MRTAFRGIRSRACTRRVGPPSEGREEDACHRTREQSPHLQPRWFIRSFWVAHRDPLSVTGGRFGLRRPTPSVGACCACGRSGAARARSAARSSATYEDGPDLVTMAMNGWADAEPGWWLNLQAHPDVDGRPARWVARRPRRVPRTGDERPRLWAGWPPYGKDLDAYAARRSPRQRSSSWSHGPDSREAVQK